MRHLAMVLASLAVGLAACAGATATRADDGPRPTCSAWTAGVEEDEGGPVLMASVCAADDPQAVLTLTCSAGTFYLRASLIGPADEAPIDEVATVRFDVDGSAVSLPMRYEDMDGAHAAELTAGSGLIGMLGAGTRLTVTDGAGRYPAHGYSLAGSARALAALAARCD
jgi:hypothetical protein